MRSNECIFSCYCCLFITNRCRLGLRSYLSNTSWPTELCIVCQIIVAAAAAADNDDTGKAMSLQTVIISSVWESVDCVYISATDSSETER